jgi:flagellar hook assembly protein FlgD
VGKPQPNPFNPITEVPVYLARDEDVSFRIYDVAGRLVRVLIQGRMRAGEYRLRWDGRKDNGSPVSSGVYFFRVEIGNRQFKDKGIVLK